MNKSIHFLRFSEAIKQLFNSRCSEEFAWLLWETGELGLDEKEISRMLKDAEEHAEEDKKRKEAVEIRNEADSLAFRAQKSLDEYKEKLPANIVTDIQARIDGVKKALEGEDIALIKSATEELNKHMQKIGEAMQQQAAGQGQQGSPPPPHGEQSGDQSDIEDAEVESLDDEK